MSEVAEKDPKESQVAINKLIRQINKALSSSIKFEPFANLFFGSPHCTCTSACAYTSISLRRRGGNNSEELSFFLLLYNTNFLNKLKLNDFSKILK